MYKGRMHKHFFDKHWAIFFYLNVSKIFTVTVKGAADLSMIIRYHKKKVQLKIIPEVYISHSE